MNDHRESVCILPRLEGVGGPASFRARLLNGLKSRGVPLASDLEDPSCRAVLVIGGISRLPDLWRARRRGARIVQRLNGMNWIHRRRFTGLKHFLKSEWNNFILATIRRSLAYHVVYQSNFARTWWQTVYKAVRSPSSVIYNGVDLSVFNPEGFGRPPAESFRLLLVEGRLDAGNEQGLDNAVRLAQRLNGLMDRRVELAVAGNVPENLRQRYDNELPGRLRWLGVVNRDEIPVVDRSAHLLFSADLNAACPNSVIEALGCGLPVVSYSTGSLPELIQNGAGLVVPWGANYWKLEPPDIAGLADAAKTILLDQEAYRPAARARAEAAFSVDTMVERYLDVLLA